MQGSCLFSILLLGLGCHTLLAEPFAKINVQTDQWARMDTPVWAFLPDSIRPADLNRIRLEEDREGLRIPLPCQIESGKAPRLWFILSGNTPANAKRTFYLSQGDPVEFPMAEIVKHDRYLQVRVGGKEVLNYNHALVPPPEGIDKLCTRSGYIHPLWSPSGQILTEIHPITPDNHPHHVGIWNPWTKTEFQGKEIDFWNLKLNQGTVRFKEFQTIEAGPIYARFTALHQHIAFLHPGEETAALDEIWDIRVYHLGGPEKGYWLWDFTTTQTCASESPLYLKTYHYGGLGFRGAKEWAFGNGECLTSEGKTRADGHASRARWCEMYGSADGKWAGVGIFSHTRNFRHPEPIRLWPKKEDPIFFCYSPVLLGDFVIEPGRPYMAQYRFYVHDQKPVPDTDERLWRDFTSPPVITLEKYPPPADPK